MMAEEDQLYDLLVQLKDFLLRNCQVEGSFSLLARLDPYITKPTNRTRIFSQEIIELNCDIQQPIQLTLISPRKFANVLDMFVLDFNFQTESYEVLGIHGANRKEIDNDRKAIMELVLCSLKDHYQQKQQTSSMTQLHKLTSNLPKNYPPLILPNYISSESKYTYIYQTKQCIEYNKKYYIVDRYYCFILDGLANQSMNQMFKKIKSCVFEQKLKHMEDPTSASWLLIRHILRGSFPVLVDRVNQIVLNLGDPEEQTWLVKQNQFYFQSIRDTVKCSLLLLVVYLGLRQFKIIMYSSKQQKHLLSDVTISMSKSLTPLTYIYPIVFCSLTTNHYNFIQSPVPLTIGYWGSQKRRSKLVNQLTQDLKDTTLKHIPTVVIDLSKRKLKCITGVGKEDVYVVEKMQKWVVKYGKMGTVGGRVGEIVRQGVQGFGSGRVGKGKGDKKNQWMGMLEDIIKKSQMYDAYINRR